MEFKSELFNYYLFGFLALILSISEAQRRQGSGISITPADQNVAKFEGESYLVSCSASDNSIIQWIDPRNAKIATSEQNRIRVESSFGLELYLNSIRTEDAGIYVCMTRNARVGFNLTVVRPITFDTNLAVQTAQEGRNAELKCVARGHSGSPKISWRINHQHPAGRFSPNPQNGNLRIRNVMEQDARNKYTCRATDVNSARPDTKDMSIQLKVQMKPRIHGPPRKDQFGVEGSYANMTCTAIAEPPAKFEWYFGNKRLTTSNEILIFSQQENVSNLQILIRKPQDFGDYTCKASNNMGQVNQTLSLKRAKKPGIPKLTIIHLGSTGVAVSGHSKPDPGRFPDPAGEASRFRAEDLPVTSYVVQFKIKTQKNWSSPPNITQTGYGFFIRNLVPNVSYVLRAAAKNQAAQGEFSPDLEFITPRGVPFNPPLNHGNNLRAGSSMGILGITALYTAISTYVHLRC